VLSVNEKYNWHRLDPVDLDALRELKNQYHLALQNVAAVGRMFLGEEENDKNAVLNWVPGLWRLAGHWITGEDTFRSSISFDDFSIYLVNEKIKTLASINLAGKKQNQVLVWLEQHIINLRLSSSHLIMNLPYELPSYPTQKGKPFADPDPELCRTLGGYFHNAFFLFAQMKETYDKTSEITLDHNRYYKIEKNINDDYFLKRSKDQVHFDTFYKFRREPLKMIQFLEINDRHQDHPDSYFVKNKIISKYDKSGGRITLTDRKLKLYIEGKLEEVDILNEDEFLSKLDQYFGIKASDLV